MPFKNIIYKKNTNISFIFNIIKNKITYKKDEVKYTLIISENSITLIRESEDFKNILTFKEKRSILSEYIIKSNDMVLEINVETLSLKNTSKEIYIEYKIKETDALHKYKITMEE